MNEIDSSQPIEAKVQKTRTSSQDIQRKKQQGKNQFKELLQDKLKTESKELKVSKHAREKLKARGIQFDQQELNKLKEAVNKGAQKGAKESLVLVDDNAYIVSVENKTVITAMTRDGMNDDVVTDIDSAILME